MRHQYHPLGFEGSRIAQGFWRCLEWGMHPPSAWALLKLAWTLA